MSVELVVAIGGLITILGGQIVLIIKATKADTRREEIADAGLNEVQKATMPTPPKV